MLLLPQSAPPPSSIFFVALSRLCAFIACEITGPNLEGSPSGQRKAVTVWKVGVLLSLNEKCSHQNENGMAHSFTKPLMSFPGSAQFRAPFFSIHTHPCDELNPTDQFLETMELICVWRHTRVEPINPRELSSTWVISVTVYCI